MSENEWLPWTLADKVLRGSDCWLWTAKKDRWGYGRVKVNGVLQQAHRYVYELNNGPVPEGLVLDHLCRVTLCVNPSHLQAVTQTENLRRSPFTNSAKTHCKNGHPFDTENTRIQTDKSGQSRRVCAICRNNRLVRYRARQRATA